MSKITHDIPQRNFELVRVKKDKGAETFVYKEVGEKSERKGLWASLLKHPASVIKLKRRTDEVQDKVRSNYGADYSK